MSKTAPKRSSTFQREDRKIRKLDLQIPDAISEERKHILKINVNQI